MFLKETASECGDGKRDQALDGASAVVPAQRYGVEVNSICRWKAEFGGMEVSEAKRLRELEAENSKLKRDLGEAELDNAALHQRSRSRENGDGHAATPGRRSPEASSHQRTPSLSPGWF